MTFIFILQNLKLTLHRYMEIYLWFDLFWKKQLGRNWKTPYLNRVYHNTYKSIRTTDMHAGYLWNKVILCLQQCSVATSMDQYLFPWCSEPWKKSQHLNPFYSSRYLTSSAWLLFEAAACSLISWILYDMQTALPTAGHQVYNVLWNIWWILSYYFLLNRLQYLFNPLWTEWTFP